MWPGDCHSVIRILGKSVEFLTMCTHYFDKNNQNRFFETRSEINHHSLSLPHRLAPRSAAPRLRFLTREAGLLERPGRGLSSWPQHPGPYLGADAVIADLDITRLLTLQGTF